MTHEIQPLIPVPKLTDKRMKELYDELMKQPIPGNIRSQEEYILLEAKQHGNYSYPDLLVSIHRLGLTNEVEQAAGKLSLKVSNTAQEQDGHQYIGNIQWEPALKLNLLLGNLTLNPRQFIDFKELLEEGIKGKKVYNGSGMLIDSKVLEGVYDEIFKVRAPWRAEWLDADFNVINQVLHINYNHRIVNSSLQPQNSEPLEACLMKNCYVDLASANKQGLPIKESKTKEIYYWYPRNDNNSVAWFDADSDWAYLGCIRLPRYSYSELGVRGAKNKVN